LKRLLFLIKNICFLFRGRKFLCLWLVEYYIKEEVLNVKEAYLYLVRKKRIYQELQIALLRDEPVKAKEILISVFYQSGDEFDARNIPEQFVAEDLISEDLDLLLMTDGSIVYRWKRDLPIFVFKKSKEVHGPKGKVNEATLSFLIGSEEKVRDFCQEQKVENCRLSETSWR
jgi:hypothetical protein